MDTKTIVVATVAGLSFDLEHHMKLATHGNRRSIVIIGRWIETDEGKTYHLAALAKRKAVAEGKKIAKREHKQKLFGADGCLKAGCGLSRFAKGQTVTQ